jgi:hypothetical protein
MERRVWIIAPEAKRESTEQAALRVEALRLAKAKGIVAHVRRTKHHVIEGGPDAQKRFDLVQPRDAGELYGAMHRQWVLVLTVGACFVRSDPSEDPTRWRHARRLDDYVRYKAAYGLAREPGDPARILASFAHWPAELGSCLDERDPRVLPLHVFDNSRVWSDLDEDAGLSTFAATYGREARRKDTNGRPWVAASVGHGRTSLTVSGLTLRQGFHWDVRGGSTERLTTCHEVWKVNTGGYANVYPDAHVRAGDRCRRVWQAS